MAILETGIIKTNPPIQPVPTIQSIQSGLSDLMAKIQKEGVTDISGKQIVAPGGTFTPTGAFTPAISSLGAISVDKLQAPAPKPIDLSGAAPSLVSGTQASALVASAAETQKSIADYLKLLTPTETPESKRIKELTSEVEGLLPGAKGRGVAQLEAETLQDIPRKRNALTAVQGQIASKIAEFNKIEADYMKAVEATERVPGTTTGIVARQQRQLARDLAIQRVANAAEVGMLQAQSQILQGNLSAAQATADRAVDLKYADINDEINTRLKQLEVLRPELTKQEKLKADAIKLYLQDKQQQVDDAKKAEKQKNSTLLSWMSDYIDAGITLNDSLELAQQKITTKSAIYKKKISGGGVDTFTNTQINSGAATAGLPISEFKQLDTDTKNFFINNSDQIKAKKKLIDEAKTKKEDPISLRNEIMNSTLPQAVKDSLGRYVKEVFPDIDKQEVSKPWWQRLFSAFGG